MFNPGPVALGINGNDEQATRLPPSHDEVIGDNHVMGDNPSQSNQTADSPQAEPKAGDQKQKQDRKGIAHPDSRPHSRDDGRH
jgi:hypothetical protein